jgi:hypothetical protein
LLPLVDGLAKAGMDVDNAVATVVVVTAAINFRLVKSLDFIRNIYL